MVSSPTFDLEAAKAAISAALRADLASVSIDELELILAPAIEGRIVSVPVLKVGTLVCRARIVVDKPLNIRDLSYPPARSAQLGRVNRPGTSVLYCSAAREGAMFEVEPTSGATVAIAQWRTTAPMVVHHVGYSKNALTQLASRRTPESWASLVSEPGGPDHAEITDFLATIFVRRVGPTEPSHFYKISVAIAEMLFAQDLFHGLLYPTIALAANSDNIAIKPTFVDQHLRFVEAELLRIQEVRENGFEVLPLDVAKDVDENGALTWRGRPKQLVVRQDRPLVLTAENGRWVARDVDGNIVEPD